MPSRQPAKPALSEVEGMPALHLEPKDNSSKQSGREARS